MLLWMTLSCIAGYLLGSLNSSLIVGKFYNTDIRKHGSGNAGTTNTLRVLGKRAALFVLIGDIFKGILAYLAGFYITGVLSGFEVTGPAIAAMAAGTAAIVGHVWPLYFGFKGGKGVLTSFAVLLMIDWQIALVLLVLFIIIVLLTRYVSLGSVVCALLFPIFSLVMGRNMAVVIFSAAIALLIIVMHRTNIKRLIEGNESKLGVKKQA
jgi:glycerol-3-phosphate acyltransferase PlsY